LDHQNNYVECLNIDDNAAKSYHSSNQFERPIIILMVQTKLFSNIICKYRWSLILLMKNVCQVFTIKISDTCLRISAHGKNNFVEVSFRVIENVFVTKYIIE